MAAAGLADIVCSIAGHDRGQLFLVVDTKDGYVYLADGKRRKLSRPKRKSQKHIALEARGDPPLKERICSGQITDSTLRKLLAFYAAAQDETTEGGNHIGKR